MRRSDTRQASILLLFSVVLLISGCFENKPLSNELSGDGSRKLKIYYPYVEDFHVKYGRLFNSRYPNIEIEVIQSTDAGEVEFESASALEKLNRMLEREKPDVLLLNQDEYNELSSLGKLYHLEPIMKQEQFDAEGYAPGVIDMLRERGNGSLFGLATTLNARFLYYNVDMFKDKQMDLPVNSMQWKEVIELAARFHNGRTDENATYGFIDNEASDVMWSVSTTMGLQLFDAEGKNVLLQSDGWKQAFQLTVDAIQQKSVSVRPSGQSGDPGSRYIMAMNKFLNGDIPMIMSDSSFASRIGESSKMNWGMVSAPIDPARVDESTLTYATQIFAIAAKSDNKQDAWAFVSFMNGVEMAKIISRTGGSDLPARKEYLPRSLERDEETLYMLKPSKHRVNEQWKKNIPESFYQAYTPMLNEALHAVASGEKTLEQAIAELEQQAQVELDIIRKR
ncbi:ABC transporter substrate-binding protein [Paenibacillus arenosi]|uniref:Extracellular solute-binding protein n=1 Tax=Paenibacillus arenosi TaxID=2774142 RepID=A0ABR9AZF8_9BACL|nr:extracellular solute-binding protein [Paenibacillus arenosi]MBD8499531.1 extracellular solute-binding protein [Paenibacillus arenosi]